MTLRAYIWGMSIVTLISLVALVGVLNYIDPSASGLIGKTLFFLVAFFVLSGMFNLILLRLRKKIINSENIHANIGLSFRQGVLLAILAIGILILQGLRLLVWWDALILLGGIFLIEVYFVVKS
jgi:hypothetical protein